MPFYMKLFWVAALETNKYLDVTSNFNYSAILCDQRKMQ